MEYRKLGRTGLEISVLSLGTEYLVKASQETVTSVVRAAVEHGVNFFDVLFADPDYRDHFGVAFDGLRDQVIISGHLPVNDAVDQCRQSFLDHLTRLRIAAVDIIFVSCCDGEENYRRAMQPGGHYELALDFVRQKKARYIGFSSHTVSVALQAVRSGRYDLLMFPINPAFDTLPGDTGADNLGNLWEKAYSRKPDSLSAGAIPERKQLYHECARREIGLVAMKPFASGWLFRPDINSGFDPINLIHYALSQPGVSCVVPGVASVEQLTHNLGYLSATGEQKDFSSAVAGSRWNYQGTCMYCNHCQPCRAGIDISEINQLINLAASSNQEDVQKAYRQLKVKASACQECGDCMQRCPFGVDVIERMKQAVAMFEADAG
jgi:predicted aldo/keto reductase-like oxidoreductase